MLQASSIEKKRESRSMEHLNTAVENRAKEEERKREEERRHNEENERRRKEDDRRRKEEERRKIEERRQKEERRKSGVRDSREKSPPKPVKNTETKEERRRDSRDSKSGGRRSTEEGKRSGSHHATINPLLSEVRKILESQDNISYWKFFSWPENMVQGGGTTDILMSWRS